MNSTHIIIPNSGNLLLTITQIYKRVIEAELTLHSAIHTAQMTQTIPCTREREIIDPITKERLVNAKLAFEKASQDAMKALQELEALYLTDIQATQTPTSVSSVPTDLDFIRICMNTLTLSDTD